MSRISSLGLRRAISLWIALLALAPGARSEAAPVTVPADICAAPVARYSRAPLTRDVAPLAVLSTDPGDGTIDNPDGLLAEDGDGATLSMIGGQPPRVIVDFGQVLSGVLSLTSLASTSPELRVSFSESLRYLSTSSDTDWGEQGAAAWTPPTGPSSFDAAQHSFRYVMLYLTTPGSVTLDALRLRFTPFIGTPDTFAGCFESSDDLLNRIWYAGAYTVDLNTVPGAGGGWTIVDGAKHDRQTWTADLAVQAQVLYDVHGLTEPVRYALVDLAQHQRGDGAIPASPYGGYSLVFSDYCAWWVIALADDYDRGGDLAFVQSVYPNLQRQMDWFERQVGADGLIRKGPGDEWAYTLNRSGAVTYLNIVYARAIQEAARLATLAGQTDDANRWSERAADLIAAINARLFDSARGVYVDSDNDATHVPLDANVLAVTFDIAPPDRRAGILAYLREHHWTPYGSVTVDPAYGINTWHDRRIWPFIGYFEVQARFQSGDEAGAWDLLRREWGHMQDSDPASTTWEWMTADGQVEDGFTSLAHGWSAGATPALTAYALGVRQTEELVIDPHPGDLTWARGRAPTAHGPVDVAWQRFDGGMSLSVVVPDGASARASVLVNADDAMVTLDGRPVWRSGESLGADAVRDGDRVWVAVSSGPHQLVATDGWQYVPETGYYLGAPFRAFWAANGGIPVFGYPLTPAFDEVNAATGSAYLVQYVERQRFEYHPENAGSPYAILLGRLGVADAERRGLSGSAPFARLSADPGLPGCTWFAATGHTACDRFLAHWQAHGLDFGDDGFSERESLALFGYPISEPFTDPDTGLTVQYFERARFEFHPENLGTQWEVLLGRLGAESAASEPPGCCAASGPR